MRKHNRPTRPAFAQAQGTTARERWHEWIVTLLANGVQQTRVATPFYDSERRQLRVGKILVKRFTQASDAQEILLMVFQEESWCRCIDDPLPVKDGQEVKQRLRTAVTNLNRRQWVPLLRFRVMNRGTGVAWEFLADNNGEAALRVD